MNGVRRSICGVALLLGGLLLTPLSGSAASPTTREAERELRMAEWARQGQLRLQAWRAAWMQGDVQQRWLALAFRGSPLERSVRLREVRELAQQPVGEAYLARRAMSTIRDLEGLPVAERDALLAKLRAQVEALDADNAITWVEALPDSRGVTPETLRRAHELLRKVAESPRIDTGGFVPLIRYFGQTSAPPLTRGDAMVLAVMFSATATPAFQHLMAWCREQPDLREACVAAGLHLTRKADTLLTAMIGLAVLDRAATEPELRAQVAEWRSELKDVQDRTVRMAPNPGEVDDATLNAFAERWFQAYAEPGATEMSVVAALSPADPAPVAD